MDEYVIDDYHGANDQSVSMKSLPTIRITPHNADSRIRDACETIIRLWDQWDAEASQEAQQAQDPQPWFESMVEQLGSVITGMVCDECHWCGGSGVVDSGGIDESGRFINVPCSECVPQQCYRTFDCNGGDHSDACPKRRAGSPPHQSRHKVQSVEWFDNTSPDDSGTTAISVNGFIGPVRAGDEIIYMRARQ